MTAFIADLLIPDLKKMVENQLHYYAFAIICQGVEVMGASLDNEPLGTDGLSKTRFGNGLTHFFRDDRYRANQAKFFSVLRGPLIHQLRPGEGFLLASTAKDNIKPEAHFTKQGAGVTLLLIEVFLDDFIDAFSTFRKKMEKKSLQSPARFTNDFIVVSELSPEIGKVKWDKDINNCVTLTPFGTGSAVPPKPFPESAVD